MNIENRFEKVLPLYRGQPDSTQIKPIMYIYEKKKLSLDRKPKN